MQMNKFPRHRAMKVKQTGSFLFIHKSDAVWRDCAHSAAPALFGTQSFHVMFFKSQSSGMLCWCVLVNRNCWLATAVLYRRLMLLLVDSYVKIHAGCWSLYWRQIAFPHGVFILNLKLCSFVFDCMSVSNNMWVRANEIIHQSFVRQKLHKVPAFRLLGCESFCFSFSLCSKVNIIGSTWSKIWCFWHLKNTLPTKKKKKINNN